MTRPGMPLGRDYVRPRLRGGLGLSATRRRAEDGQISVMVLGIFVIVLMFIAGAVDVTAAQLARMRLLDTADAIALGAADGVDEQPLYQQGISDRLVLTDASVQSAATSHLSRIPPPPGITEWGVVPQTGTPDGATAVVTVSGRASLPMTGWFLESFGGGVTITVTSRARAPLG